jgi:RNA polymerase sigma-70 factor (ECF subfamily)
MNACYDEARRVRRRSQDIHILPLDTSSGRDDANDVIDRDELERGFRRLSVEQRTVLVMTHYLGMSAREVAETLEIPVGTVQSRLLYAIRAMRAVLEADARPVSIAAGGRS